MVVVVVVHNYAVVGEVVSPVPMMIRLRTMVPIGLMVRVVLVVLWPVLVLIALLAICHGGLLPGYGLGHGGSADQRKRRGTSHEGFG